MAWSSPPSPGWPQRATADHIAMASLGYSVADGGALVSNRQPLQTSCGRIVELLAPTPQPMEALSGRTWIIARVARREAGRVPQSSELSTDAGAGPASHFCVCILTFAHFGHIHFRFLWKMCPFISFIGTLQVLQVTSTPSTSRIAPCRSAARRSVAAAAAVAGRNGGKGRGCPSDLTRFAGRPGDHTGRNPAAESRGKPG
jgi:hypothetical protein